MPTMILDRSFTYDLDDGTGRKRTLPLGWSGPVSAGLAKKIKGAGAGRETEKPAAPAPAKADAKADAKAQAEADAAAKSGEGA